MSWHDWIMLLDYADRLAAAERRADVRRQNSWPADPVYCSDGSRWET